MNIIIIFQDVLSKIKLRTRFIICEIWLLHGILRLLLTFLIEYIYFSNVYVFIYATTSKIDRKSTNIINEMLRSPNI